MNAVEANKIAEYLNDQTDIFEVFAMPNFCAIERGYIICVEAGDYNEVVCGADEYIGAIIDEIRWHEKCYLGVY